MRLLLATHAPWGGGYSSARTEGVWLLGESRPVSGEVAEYLLTTFPEYFSVVEGSPSSPPPSEGEPPSTPDAPRKRKG